MTTKERINFTLEWNKHDLMIAFRRFLANSVSTTKIILFIDGLDEFDGDHQNMIQFFKGLAEGEFSARIKICLSSRPWKVFENAFESSVPNLKLQDLTFYDIHGYVSDKLLEYKPFSGILGCDKPWMDALIGNVVKKADGVFLWARLVVRSLLKAFGSSSSHTHEVDAFLHSLPTELEELFSRLLFTSQTREQMTTASHIFQLMQARETVSDFIKDESANSLTVWEVAFALHHSDDKVVLERSPSEAKDQDILTRCITTRDHITDRSAGLLEIFPNRSERIKMKSVKLPRKESQGKMARKLAAHTVTYLHRTIRDYLMLSPGIWPHLISHSGVDFDPHLRLLRSYVLRLKSPLEEIEHHRRIDEWWPDIALALTHVRYIDPLLDAQHFQNKLINSLDDTISFYWERRSGDPYDHWARSCFGAYEARKGNKMIFPDPFLALCTKFGLEIYVLDRLEEMLQSENKSQGQLDEEYGPDALVEETPLLSYALEYLTSRQKTIYPLSSESLVRYLLLYRNVKNTRVARFIGCPNMVYDAPLSKKFKVTPWIMTLRHLRDGKRRGWIQSFDIEANGTNRWTAIIRDLLEGGDADRHAIVEKDKWDPEINAEGVVVGILGSVQDYWISELRKYFEQKS